MGNPEEISSSGNVNAGYVATEEKASTDNPPPYSASKTHYS